MTAIASAANASSDRKFQCEDCGARHVNCPMLIDELWRAIAGKEALLCWSCAEHRLGRDIHAEDLLECGWTSDLRRVAYRINAGRWWEDGRLPFGANASPAPDRRLEIDFRVAMKLWREHGGGQHGPHVETLTMPLEWFKGFLVAFLAAAIKLEEPK